MKANQKIQIGFSVIAGGAIAGFIVDRGSVLNEHSSSTTICCLGVAAGTLAAGTTATYLSKDQLTDSNYKDALSFIVMELLKAQKKLLNCSI